MFWIKKNLIILSFLFFLPIHTFAQRGLLYRKDLLPEISQILALTYNYKFDKAKKMLSEIQKKIPDHPATTFLEALILYWEFYPLTTENPNSASFLRLMEETSVKAEAMAEKDEEDLEGIFFSLFSKAFYIMYWADNGKPSKVFPYLNFLYHQTMKSMERKDEFVEFYFSSGLYNYYIEAYPDKHPIFKPVKFLFRKGNKTEGLEELKYCAENAVYLKVEAQYFLTLLYLGYENNPGKASEYASSLYREFPDNICYIGNYAETLLFDKKYEIAEIVIHNLSKKKDTFSALQTHVLNGYLLEKDKKNFEGAFVEYKEGLSLCELYGPISNHFKVMSWMGLGRYYNRKGNFPEASKYFKLAKNNSSYEYVIEDK
jgi:hypothetical protein